MAKLIEEGNSRNVSHGFTIWISYVVWLRSILARTEQIYEALGRKIAKHPKKTILIAVLGVALCGLGLLRLRTERRAAELFVPMRTKSNIALEKGEKFFPNTLNRRVEEIVFLPKNGTNVMEVKCIKEALRVIETAQNITRYKDLCSKRPAFLNENGRRLFKKEETCSLMNPLQVLTGRENEGIIFRKFRRAVSSTASLMSNGRASIYNFNNGLAQFKLDAKKRLVFAKAMRIELYLEQGKNESHQKMLMNWEKEFVSTMSQVKKDLKYVEITYSTERSLDDAITESSSKDVSLISITFAIMITFSCFMLAKFINPVRGHTWLAMSGVFSTGLGILAGIGVTACLGVPFTSLVGIVPFLVVSIGIDDMFIIADEFDRQDKSHIPVNRVSFALSKVGATITMTTVTDIIAFFVSSTSTFPAIRYFCIYTALCISIEFLLQITLFIAFLSFDARRIFSNRNDCCPSIQVQDRTCCRLPNQFSWSAKIMRSYAEKLITKPGKIMVLLLTVGLVAFGLFGCFHVRNEFNRKMLAIKGSYYSDYLHAFEGNFPQTVPVSIQITSKVNYSDANVRRQISELPEIAYNTGYYLSQNVTWVHHFEQFVKQFNINGNGAYFNMAMKAFLSIPVYSQHNVDIIRDKYGEIIASRVIVFLKDNSESTFQKDAMLKLREHLTRYSELDFTAAADPFIYFEQYAVVAEEVRNNVLLVAFIIGLMLIPFCIHPLVIFFVMLCFLLLIIELFGLMYFWEVHLNAISMINIVMAIGFTVDYCTHITHSFVTSTEDSVDKRIVDALSTVGGSVLLGGVSTFLGMSLTGLATTAIFQIFFKMFLGIILFGLYNGFVLLPVLLSIFSRYVDFQINKVPHDTKLLSPIKFVKSLIAKIIGKTRKPVQRHSISILGMSTRFPTASNKTEFIKLLESGGNTIAKYPEDRYARGQFFEDCFNPARPVAGKLYVSNGSYLENIDKFDHQFFGISATEAKSMDPQQRMLLQGVYEATEDAGMTLEEIQQCTTGVYIGIMNLDYSSVVLRDDTILKIDQFASTGTAFSIAANRISFSLNLTGPSVAIDTACSSSMTALSLACDHLEKRVVDVAIVAAANLILCPRKQTTICRANMLAPDGKCKVFDEKADGYGRGEAIVAFILKASDLVAAKDEPYAEILGWGINNDGQTAAPITAPSVESQRDLMINVLQQANVNSKQFHFVEMHGTGTIIGDLVETKSVGEVYGKPRTLKHPVPIGSVKSNINHTESTAGLAGLAKVCLMMEANKIFPTVGLENQAIRLDIDERGLRIPTEIEEWQVGKHELKLAAINSFGYGGSNAHLVVREAKKLKSCQEEIIIEMSEDQPLRLIVLSARSLQGITETAERFSKWLLTIEDNKQNMNSVCYTLNERRTNHGVRLAVASESLKGFSEKLALFSKDSSKSNAGFSLGRTKQFGSSVAFVFGGQGSQWLGMAGDLIKLPRIHMDVKKINKYARKNGHDKCLLAYLMAAENADQTDCLVTVQLSIFALQYAVANFLRTQAGIEPVAVGGHSLGDITAACVAGIIKPKKAVKIIMARASLQEQCKSDGAMAAVGLSVKEVKSILETLSIENQICIAAENDKDSITISGDKDAIDKMEEHIKEMDKDVFWRKLATHKAFHSHHMDTIEEEFKKKIKEANVKLKTAKSLFISTTEGRQMNANEIDNDYWWRNLRNPVQFNSCVKKILSDGIRVIIEISPRPVLSHYIHAIAKQADIEDLNVIQALPSKKEAERSKHFYACCIGQMYTIGYPISINALQDQRAGRFLRYPLYPWQETDLWAEDEYNVPKKTMHLIGVPNFVNSQRLIWDNEIDLHRFAYLSDHVMKSSGVILPGACYVELALEASLISNKLEPAVVKDMKFMNVLPLHEHVVRQVKCIKQKSEQNDEFKIIHVTDRGEVTLSTATLVSFEKKANENSMTLHEALTINPCDGSNAASVDKRHSDSKTESADEGLGWEKDSGESNASSSSNPVSNMKIDFEGSAEISDNAIDSSTNLNETKQMIENENEPSVLPEDNALLKNLDFKNVTKELDASAFKELAAKSGFQFGDCFSLIERAWSGENQALVRLRIPKAIEGELSLYVMHPCIIDACLQSCIAIGSTDPDRNVIPVGINGVRLNPIKRNFKYLYGYAQVSNVAPDTCDVKLLDEHGNIILILQGFTVQELSKAQRLPTLETSIYEMNWLPSPLPTVSEDMLDHDKIFIIGFKNNSVFKLIMEVLDQLKFPSECTTFQEVSGSEIIADFQEQFTQKINIEEVADQKVLVINLLPLFAHTVSNEEISNLTAYWLCFESTLEILKALSKHEMKKSKLVTYTHRCFDGRLHSDGGTSIPWAATVLGMARATNLETEIPLIPVDIGMKPTVEEVKATLLSLKLRSVEEGIIVSPTNIHQPLFQRVKNCEKENIFEVTPLGTGEMFYLSWSQSEHKYCVKEDVDGVRLMANDQIKVDIKYVSLPAGSTKLLLNNVKSVDSVSLLQCAYGVVSDAPENTNGLKVGDEIICVYNSKWVRNCIRVPVRNVVKKPLEFNPEQAAVLTGCFALANNILSRLLASSKKIANIFIYSTKLNRGLCSALAEVAKRKGLDVTFEDESSKLEDPTGCSLAKISEHYMRGSSDYTNKFDCAIFSSNLHPADHTALLAAIKKDGIIMVLDNEVHSSLSRYETSKSIAVLNYKLSEANLAVNEFSSAVNNILADGVLEAFKSDSNHTKVLPVSDICNSTKVADLFNDFTLFDCIKIDSENLLSYPASMDIQGLKEDRSYIVIGGSKGLGFNTVAWMAARGAGTIIAVGRSQLTKECDEDFKKLELRHGSKIKYVQADASTKNGITVLQHELNQCPKLAGVVNSGAVLDDKLFQDVDRENYKKVMAPKIHGTMLLNEMLQNEAIDFFVLYSSITSVLGNNGQTVYAAANAFLNSFAEFRTKTLKKPCLSVCWGAMGGGGMLARNTNVAMLLEKSGLHLLDIPIGLKWMDEVLTTMPERSNICICDVDWRTFLNSLPIRKAHSLIYDEMWKEIPKAENNIENILEMILKERSNEKRLEIITGYIKGWIAAWISGSAEEVDCNVPLFTYGIDSVGATALKSQIEKDLQLDFQVFYFMQPETTITKLAQDLLKAIHEKFIKKAENEEEDIEDERTGEEEQLLKEKEEDENKLELPENYLTAIYQPDGAQANLFLVHPSHRYSGSFSAFAIGMKYQKIFSLYAFGSQDPAYMGEDIESVSRLAKACISLLLKVQPCGPFFIGGYSFGGLVSLEIASMLEEAGHKVAFVVMIDTVRWLPSGRSNAKLILDMFDDEYAAEVHIREQMDGFLCRIATKHLGMTVEGYQQKTKGISLEEIQEMLSERAKTLEKGIPDIKNIILSIRNDQSMAERCHDAWLPPMNLYRGDIMYIQAQDDKFCKKMAGIGSSADCWSDILLNRITTVTCTGDHYSMMDPNRGPDVGKVVSVAALLKYRSLFPQRCRLFENAWHKQSLTDLKQRGLKAVFILKKVRMKFAVSGKVKLSKSLKRMKFIHDSKMYSKVKLNMKDVKNITKLDVHDTDVTAGVKGIERFTVYAGLCLMTSDDHKFRVMCYNGQDYRRLLYTLEAIFSIKLPL